jgi:hypothetical protein
MLIMIGIAGCAILILIKVSHTLDGIADRVEQMAEQRH